MSTAPISAVESWLQEHAAESVDDLKTLLSIPSISAISKHKGDMLRAAEFLREQLADCGCEAEIVSTPGHPLVFASWTKKPGAPTALVYGHYDVQPVDPLNEWETPPFEPTVRNGKIYARGATDDKGQMLTHVKSVSAWLQATGELPINVKFVIEGEEEVGSNHLEAFLSENKERCACDVVVVSDTSQYGPGMPAVTYGLRGILACEVTLSGPKQDLHSGLFGGAVANPVNGLCQLLAQLHRDGKVQVPGFYDDVLPLTEEERSGFAALPFDEQQFLANVGATAAVGEPGFSTLERRWARPTCDINGITGGYQGEGPKTIIPSKATAKLTCRLVPNQSADKLVLAVEKFLQDHCPPGLTLKFKAHHGCDAVVCDLHSSYMQSARRAIEKGFGREPVMIREGGSIPVVATFKRLLGVDTLLLGWGQNTDNLHGPNEHFDLDAFQRGTLASAWLWGELGVRK